MNSTSVGDSFSLRPTEKPSVVQEAGIGYIMIDSRSTGVLETSPGSYRLKMLFSMVASSQLLGGPDRSAMTAARFQETGVLGFWCSWMRPSAWPNSCRTTLRSSSSGESGVSQP